jgi:hypothetical protein
MESMAQFVQQFRIEEYKALRSEILYQIGAIDGIKFWVAAAMAAYYSFILAKFLVAKDNRVELIGPLWVWAAPLLFPIIGLTRLMAHMKQLNIFAMYT